MPAAPVSVVLEPWEWGRPATTAATVVPEDQEAALRRACGWSACNAYAIRFPPARLHPARHAQQHLPGGSLHERTCHVAHWAALAVALQALGVGLDTDGGRAAAVQAGGRAVCCCQPCGVRCCILLRC